MQIYTVFISYSWDSEPHKEWVLNLADNLVKNGIDVLLDQYDLSAGKEMTFFMEKAMTADKTLVILTPNYRLKADKRAGGVGYEYSMITKDYYDKEPDKARIIPILRNGDVNTSCPTFMQTRIYHDMRNDEKFDSKLFEAIKIIVDKPLVKKPPLGALPGFDDNVMPDFEKTISDFKKKEEYLIKRKMIIHSADGVNYFLDEVQKIIEFISKTLEGYRANFGMKLFEKSKYKESIFFSSIDHTFHIRAVNDYLNDASEARIIMLFFRGIVGFDDMGFAPLETREELYFRKYKFDLNESIEPIFVKEGDMSVKLSYHELASTAIRDLITHHIKAKENELGR